MLWIELPVCLSVRIATDRQNKSVVTNYKPMGYLAGMLFSIT